jgi:hypothetical protein
MDGHWANLGGTRKNNTEHVGSIDKASDLHQKRFRLEKRQ